MEFQVLKNIFFGFGLSLMLVSCEKEIEVSIPGGEQQWVVEATVNQRFQHLNYVYISKTLDYFNPDLSLNGVNGAEVYITEGEINGTDTIYPDSKRYRFTTILDSIAPGIYINLGFTAKTETPYLLTINMPDGVKITGKSFLRKPPLIDSISYYFQENGKDTNAFLYFQWQDGPDQDNYRLTLWDYPDSILPGWGAGTRFYTFDDRFFNNVTRPFQTIAPIFKYGDTINIYLSQIGRQEYLFWDSFREAASNGGPFATPVSVKSNINGAIGSFTAIGLEFKQVIMR